MANELSKMIVELVDAGGSVTVARDLRFEERRYIASYQAPRSEWHPFGPPICGVGISVEQAVVDLLGKVDENVARK